MNWLRKELINYLYENVHNADFPIEEIADDIIDLIKQARDYGFSLLDD